MKKQCYLTFLLLAISFFLLKADAQHKGMVKAQVFDSKKQPVEMATAAVLGADSTVVRTTVTDKDGKLKIDGLSFGTYRLIVSQLGLQHKPVSFTVSAQQPLADLGRLEMEMSVHKLNEVNITAEKAPVTIKKDTIEFNASSFKTQKNDNVEDLFKKLPGVDVDKDGKITAQGQQVKKVLVDGKEFFGNDPKAVTKNLPADAVKTVQLIDDKTDKAKNTGIDDGQREKVMNVTLKDDKKKGWFGNISGAGGNQNRYLGQFNLNHFDNKKQLSFLFLSNNVNESGFTMEDLNNFAGSGSLFDMFSSSNGGINININSSGRANINGAFSGVNGGLITSHSAGINYSDEYAKGKLKFNVNTLSILSRNTIAQTSNIQDLPNNLFTDQFSNGNNTSNSYRLNFSLDYKLDSLTSFKFKPSLSTTYKKNNSALTSGTIGQLMDSVNSIRQLFDQTTHSPAIGGQFTVNRKLHNGNGSVNFFVNGNYSANNADYTNKSLTRFYQTSQANIDLNQLASQDADVSFINGTGSFVRSLNKKQMLSLTLSQSFNLQKQNANQNTLDYNAVTGNYEILNPLYSGVSDNNSHRYTTTAGLSKSNELINLNVNMAVAELGLSGYSNANNTVNNVGREAWALVPNVSFSFRKKNGPNLYIGVGTDVNLPSATDLQTVFTNTNPLYIRQGNPDLVMSRSLYANANYNYFDMKNNTFFNFYGNYNTTYNGFSTASTLAGGVTTSMPINVDGNYSISGGFNIGKPTKIKGLKFNVGSYSSINRSINFINGNRNAVTRLSPQVNLGSSFDRDQFQTSFSTSFNYNNAKNSYQSAADRDYYSFNNRLSGSVLPVKTLRIFSDVTQSLYRGQPASANTTYYLWNAGIERYFLKDKNLTLSLNAFDLLNQNAGIQRSVTQLGAIQINQTNTLGRYFYLKLIYKITKVGGAGPATGNKGIIIMR